MCDLCVTRYPALPHPRIHVGCPNSNPNVVQNNLVVNGGFETGSFAPWVQGGNTGFTGIDTALVHSGTYAAFFGPVGSDGTLSQALAVTPRTTYTVAFWLANPSGATPSDFAFFIDGVQYFSQVNSPAFGYTPFSFTFTTPAAGPNSVTLSIRFQFRDDPDFQYLDDISVCTPTIPLRRRLQAAEKEPGTAP